MQDYTKYSFDNKKLGKGRLVFDVIKKYISSNPNTTYEYLKTIFPDNIQSNSKIQFSETQVVFSKIGEITETELSRFFNKESDVIKIKGSYILVCNQWNIENIQNFINTARELGYEIKDYE